MIIYIFKIKQRPYGYDGAIRITQSISAVLCRSYFEITGGVILVSSKCVIMG